MIMSTTPSSYKEIPVTHSKKVLMKTKEYIEYTKELMDKLGPDFTLAECMSKLDAYLNTLLRYMDNKY